MIEIFVNNFIEQQYRERILYELQSNKVNKKEKAFTKLLDYNEYFLPTLIKLDLSHKTDEEIISILNAKVKSDNGYSLKWQVNKNLVRSVIDAINSYSLDIILVDENMIVYIGEFYHNKDSSNAFAKFLFYK